MTPAERAKKWQHDERDKGACVRCREPHGDVNPRTGRRYWRCASCRANQRADDKAIYWGGRAVGHAAWEA